MKYFNLLAHLIEFYIQTQNISIHTNHTVSLNISFTILKKKAHQWYALFFKHLNFNKTIGHVQN